MYTIFMSPRDNCLLLMEKIKTFVNKARYSYRSLPDKKRYIEFFTALLTVPVLLTVIIVNLNNLKGTAKSEEPTPAPKESRPIVVTVPEIKTSEAPQVTPSSEACKKGIGPIGIDYPEENSTVTDNPVLIDINYQTGEYCAVVWAYRINDSRFSDYDDKSIALYNPPKGVIRFQLKVKSIVTGEEKILTRTFTYNGAITETQPSASGSAN